MNRIDFDYEKIKEGYKPVYRNGLYPTEVHRFETVMDQCIVSVICYDFKSHYPNGRYQKSEDDSPLDLFLELPVIVEWWVTDLKDRSYRSFPTSKLAEDRINWELECKNERLYQGIYVMQKATYHANELISVELVTAPKNTNER